LRFNSNGQMSLSIAKATSAATFSGTVTANGLTVDGAALVRSGNTLTLNRTDNAIGGAMSYVAGTGFIFNDVNGDGTSFNVGAANKFRIDSSGNVGIGTSSPATSLHVNSGANGEILRIQGADAQLRIDNSTANVMNINSSGSGDSLTLSTNDTERLRLDASGNVGIGTSDPSTYGVDGAEDLVIGQADGNHGLTISSFGSSNGTIAFSDQTNAAVGRGYLDYDHSVNAMTVGTNGTERLRIDSSGNVGIGSSTTYGLLNSTRSITGGTSNTTEHLSLVNTAIGAIGNQATLGFHVAASSWGVDFTGATVSAESESASTGATSLVFGTNP
jgi:hypothetical protein